MICHAGEYETRSAGSKAQSADTARAAFWIQKAADQHLLLTEFNLDFLLMNGLGTDLTLAYCYEKGIGLPQNKGEAHRILHKALLRGSETAFRAHRGRHDHIRPPDKEFQMPD